jgi:hypothetical protein
MRRVFPFREYALRVGHFPAGSISPIRFVLTSNVNSESTGHAVSTRLLKRRIPQVLRDAMKGAVLSVDCESSGIA